MASNISTQGFIKELPSDQIQAQIDRRRYKPEICSEYGGLRGYVIGVLYNKSVKAVNADNPDGIFPDLVWRLTAPAPVVDSKDNVVRAEVGEDVLLVATHQLKKLIDLASDARYCCEATVIFKGKEKTGNGKNLWHTDISFNIERQDKAKIVPEVGLLLSFKESKENPKLLGDSETPF